MQNFWDQRYSENETVYGKTPNIYFKNKIVAIPPSTLLLPAEGEGRNAVYAATLGWKVMAFDYSAMAKLKAEELASSKGVQVIYNVSDINQFEVNQQYGAIALIFVHLPSQERKVFHQKMVDALAPDGVLILEAFTKDQINNVSGGPKSLDQLYSIEVLLEDFADLDILELVEEEIFLDEGPFHKGKANLIRLFAKK